MSAEKLDDTQWTKIRDFLKADPNAYIEKNKEECCSFVEGLLWISRSVSRWRLLPTEYGKWNSFADDPDMENGMIDSTIVRAHPCAAGAKKSGGQEAQALGRSRGGFSTKIHITLDGLGNPMRVRLTTGQATDIGQAVALVDGLDFDRMIADRGYAAQEFYDWILDQGMEPVIPPHQRTKGEKAERPYDKWLYRERHLVECFINKIKHFRRVFSRYDKLASRYLGFLQFVSSLVWLR